MRNPDYKVTIIARDLDIIREINKKEFGSFDRNSLILNESEYSRIGPNNLLFDIFLDIFPIDYVLVKREGTISFWHTTNKDGIDDIIKNGIIASESDDSKSFGIGIYSYLTQVRTVNDSPNIVIQGTFTGTYYECIVDIYSDKYIPKKALLEIDVIRPNNLFIDYLK